MANQFIDALLKRRREEREKQAAEELFTRQAEEAEKGREIQRTGQAQEQARFESTQALNERRFESEEESRRQASALTFQELINTGKARPFVPQVDPGPIQLGEGVTAQHVPTPGQALRVGDQFVVPTTLEERTKEAGRLRRDEEKLNTNQKIDQAIEFYTRYEDTPNFKDNPNAQAQLVGQALGYAGIGEPASEVEFASRLLQQAYPAEPGKVPRGNSERAERIMQRYELFKKSQHHVPMAGMNFGQNTSRDSLATNMLRHVAARYAKEHEGQAPDNEIMNRMLQEYINSPELQAAAAKDPNFNIVLAKAVDEAQRALQNMPTPTKNVFAEELAKRTKANQTTQPPTTPPAQSLPVARPAPGIPPAKPPQPKVSPQSSQPREKRFGRDLDYIQRMLKEFNLLRRGQVPTEN
jgi:hypothetical protein